MLLVVSIFSGIIAGMGVGGGSVFILLTTILNIFSHKEAQGYNLIMFIVIGISATIYNIKTKNLKIDLLIKIVIPICFGSLVGIYLVNILNEDLLKNIFYAFMVLIGVYEIISSLKNIFTGKNKSKSERSD